MPRPPDVSSGWSKPNTSRKTKSPHPSPPEARLRWLRVPRILLILLLIVLVGGAILLVFAGPLLPSGGKGGSAAHPTSTPIIASAATVTITPASRQLSNTFTINAVTGTPTSEQVQARLLSARTGTYSKTVNATGQGTTSGAHATGTLSMYNSSSAPITVTAGSIFPCNDNITCSSQASSLHVVVDQTVVVPLPGQPPLPPVPAHVQEVGAIGNFGIGNDCCFGYYDRTSGLGFVNAQAFTGGSDPQPYIYVQQSDIDTAANSLISANQPDPGQVLQGQLQSNEAMVGTPQCSPTTSADHRAGDVASQVTVSVSFTCTGEAYDHDGALALAANALTNQAASDPGTAYALSGQIKTTLNTATSDSDGTVTLTITAAGVWVYQFSLAQQQALASMIAGLSLPAAELMLAKQGGVARVSIQLAESNAQRLPTTPGAITIVVQSVPGA